ncbi:MAG: hypothetical protein VYD87_00725 [Pseudomonadota bacterium]|nr:hypothetical protein [Pseudomonadota bacterium]MEE3098648.1 hypothetical protein [Pseudomonadota bacterium]
MTRTRPGPGPDPRFGAPSDPTADAIAAVAAREVAPDLPACHGAFPLVSPARLQAAAALAGAPARAFRRVLMLEVGSGVGLAAQAAALAGTGAEILAQTSEPDEAAHAAALLAESGLDLPLHAGPPETLEEMPAGTQAGLDALDLVVMPWGWDLAGPAARAAILALLSRRLAPGGGFLLTRSVAPGALGDAALRQLIRSRWAAAADLSDPAARMARTLEEAERIALCSQRFMRGAVDWAETRDRMRRLPPEVFARIWGAPRPPVEDARALGAALSAAGLTRWTPADPLRLAPSFDMTEAQMAELDRCADPFLAAETADLMLMRQTRTDLFLKPGGPEAAPGALALAAAPDLPARIAAGLRVEGMLGPMTLARAAYLPLAEALVEGPARLDALGESLDEPPAALVERAAVLLGAGLAEPRPHGAAEPPAEAVAACARLRENLLRRGIAWVGGDPRTGGAERAAIRP